MKQPCSAREDGGENPIQGQALQESWAGDISPGPRDL